MTQALPDILTALSKLIPERVQLRTDSNGNKHWYAWVSLNGGHWEHVACQSKHHELLPTQSGAVWLEVYCRQEIAARSWTWELESLTDGRAYAAVSRITDPRGHGGFADTPAHALSVALLSALNAAQAAAVAADRQAHPESPFDEAGFQ